ncbi:MAG: hypothetical protein AAB638_04220 [Patescibacteria group bacterium]
MKFISIILLLIALSVPIFALAQETIETERVQASIQNNGNWELTDTLTQVTWYGEWITENLMKVTGSDDSCFVIGENETGMVQLDCQDLKQISILLSYI